MKVSLHLDFFNRVLIGYFLLINIIVVISFSVSKLLNCREFKQLVTVRDSGELKKYSSLLHILHVHRPNNSNCS